MTPFWMSSLVTPGSVPPPSPLEKQPALTGPGSVSCSHGGYRPLGLHFLAPWLSYHSVLLLTPAPCSFRGTQITRRSVPLSLFHTSSTSLPPHAGSRLLPQDAALEICRRQTDLSVSAACFPSPPAACAPSPGSPAAPRPLISPPRVTRPGFRCVDLNKICLHLTVRL